MSQFKQVFSQLCEKNVFNKKLKNVFSTCEENSSIEIYQSLSDYYNSLVKGLRKK
jgi:hypothetical protein